MFAAVSQWETLKQTLLSDTRAYHEAHPLSHGIPREELREQSKQSLRVFNVAIRKLVNEHQLMDRSGWIALPTHQIRFSPTQQSQVDRLMARFKAVPASPPGIKECQAEVGEDVFNTLVDMGELIAVSTEVTFRREDYEAFVTKIRTLLEEKGQATLAEVRDLLQTSRRYVQALLEHMDESGITVRRGDFRRLAR